eukprot:53660-Amphidinium_carterae.1
MLTISTQEPPAAVVCQKCCQHWLYSLWYCDIVTLPLLGCPGHSMTMASLDGQIIQAPVPIAALSVDRFLDSIPTPTKQRRMGKQSPSDFLP